MSSSGISHIQGTREPKETDSWRLMAAVCVERPERIVGWDFQLQFYNRLWRKGVAGRGHSTVGDNKPGA